MTRGEKLVDELLARGIEYKQAISTPYQNIIRFREREHANACLKIIKKDYPKLYKKINGYLSGKHKNEKVMCETEAIGINEYIIVGYYLYWGDLENVN